MSRTLDKLCNMMNLTDISLLSACEIKKRIKYFEIPEQEMWRVQSMNELL